MPVTYRGLNISGPFPKQETDQVGACSVLKTDKSIDRGSGANPAYESLRAATPPTPVHHQPAQRDRMDTRGESYAFASGSTAPLHGRSELRRSSKWSLSRSGSVQSKPADNCSPVMTTIDASRNIQPPSQAAMGGSKGSVKASIVGFVQTTSQPHVPEIKQPGQSWSSKLLTRTRSTLSLDEAASTTSKKAAGAPPRPDRPTESVGLSRDSVQSSALTDYGVEGGNARIDSYGWQNIKPLPNRNDVDSGAIHALQRRESVFSGSCYSADWEDDQSLHATSSTTRASARIDKHRETARNVDKKGKTHIGPPTINLPISRAARHSKEDAKSKLTAVTEEETEPDYDKPLPAPPSSSCEPGPEASASARRKKSHPILLQSQYRPCWEEQEIKKSDLCLEGNETQHSSLEAQAPSTERSQASTMKDDETESGSTESPEKSILLTEIARSYVDEQRRAEDRERQEQYRKEMRGKRLGLQMSSESPISEGESRVRSGDGQRKWRFSAFENEIESRPNTAGNSSDDSLGKLETPKDMKRVTTSVSTAASTLTLPESEKVKMRPPPLEINTKKANQTTMPKSRPSNSSSKDTPSFTKVKHPSALPTPLRTHNPKHRPQAEASTTRTAVMRLSDGTPVRSPCLIRRNGEILLPPKNDNASLPQNPSLSPVSPTSSLASSKTWSHDEASLDTEKQPDTPPTADFFRYEHKDRTIIPKGDDASDILDFYLDQYNAEVAPAVPKKSPRRSLITTDTAATKDADGIKNDRTSTYTTSSNPFRDQSDDEDEDDGRKQWEEEERHKRVAAILDRLRARD